MVTKYFWLRSSNSFNNFSISVGVISDGNIGAENLYRRVILLVGYNHKTVKNIKDLSRDTPARYAIINIILYQSKKDV